MLALIAVVAVLVTADIGLVAIRLSSGHPTGSPVASQPAPGQTGHPCNHGNYVSRAAHQHKGGKYVSGVARSALGKNGSCTAPLPEG